MITLNITADTPAALIRQIVALGALTAATGEEVERGSAPVEEKPAPKPRTNKPAAEKPSPEKGNGADEERVATKSEAPSSAADNASDVTTVDCSDRAAVKNYFSAAIDNLGPQIVQEVMAEHGAQKFGDIPPTKYEALVIRLSELQQGKGE